MQAKFYPDITAAIKIRSGPGTSYKILHQLKPGSTIAVTGRNGSWCRVNVDGKEGYVFGGLIDTAGSTNAGYESGKIIHPSQIKDESGKTVAHAYKGEHVIILSGNDKQYKVMLVDGKSGYLDKEATEPAAAVKPQAVKETMVNKPIITEPVLKKTAVKKPIVKKNIVKEPAVKETVTKEPVVQEPVVQEPVAKKPEAQDSAAQETAKRPVKRARVHPHKHSETPPPFVP
jgi:uncharacterized protein YgiM (DUF1202 family)